MLWFELLSIPLNEDVVRKKSESPTLAISAKAMVQHEISQLSYNRTADQGYQCSIQKSCCYYSRKTRRYIPKQGI